MNIIVLLPILFLSIILHEIAHGWVAYRMGDDTAYLSGRLTLNPIPHIDMIGTFVVPALCFVLGWPLFGWAKPVPINPLRLPSPRKSMGKVAFAGPAANLLLAVACVVLLKLTQLTYPLLGARLSGSVAYILAYGMFINIFLAVFNLLPISPLDGGRVLTALLPIKMAVLYEHFIGRYGMWIVFGLIVTGAIKYLLFPPVEVLVTLLTQGFQV